MATTNKRMKLVNSQSTRVLHRNNNINNLDVGVDRISELHESLIIHILSFLPTELAVSTTVLSKRWNNLWMSMPVLDFRERRTLIDDDIGWESRDQLLRRTNRFMAFLDRTLLFNNISKIEKFCLNCDSDLFDENRVKAWITAVINRKVEELILIVVLPNPKLVPLEIFTCESLTMLEINFEFRQLVLHFPQSISLPRLKLLRLSGVKFKDTASTQQLFSNCPILEELDLCECIGEDIISISAPNLKKFVLQDLYDFKVKIDAPNLLFFKFCGRLPADFPVGSFPSLVEVDLLYSSPAETTTKDSFTRMFSNIKLLKISYQYLQIFDTANVHSTGSSLPLDELMHLEVRYYDPRTSRPSIKPLFNFLHFSPNLESLVIYQEHCTQKIDGNMTRLNRPPRCLQMHLKSFEFRNFNGRPEEMGLVKLILKHARVLQRVIIRSTVSSSVEEDFLSEGIIEKLLRFPKVSKNCSFQVFEKECT